ncbi:putative ABC transporter permease/ATP-binding protein, partial [Gordonia rhizosphera NBRC 16068]
EACLADLAIAILDEATDEAGSHHVAEVERAAAVVTRGRTALVSAHRLDQIRSADIVALLDDGVVTEHGPPDELVAAGGVLEQMWSARTERRTPDNDLTSRLSDRLTERPNDPEGHI